MDIQACVVKSYTRYLVHLAMIMLCLIILHLGRKEINTNGSSFNLGIPLFH